jgi:hypothetical protein
VADDKIVTKWSLDAKSFNAGIKSMKRSLSDAQAGFQLATQAVGAFGRIMAESLTRGAQFARLQDANTLSIEAARNATKGLVSDMGLLKAANSAQAFDLGLSEKQFAKLTQAAVVMSQKLGTDANQAIGDLTLGLARQSRKILDNLGIMVSVTKANEDWAKANNASAKSLTDVQQKAAFMEATMKELDRLTGDTAINIKNAGDQYEVLTNQLDNSLNSLSRALIETKAFKDLLEGIATTIGDVATGVRIMSGTIDAMDKSISQALTRLSVWTDLIGGDSGKAIRKAAAALADYRNKVAAVQSSIDKWIETGPQLPGITPFTRGGGKGTGGGGKGGQKGIDVGQFVGRGERARGLDEIDQDLDFIPFKVNTDEVIAKTDPLSERVGALADQFVALNEASKSAALSIKEDYGKAIADLVDKQETQLMDQAIQGLASGLVTAARAAIEGKKSFKDAMLSMVSDVMWGIATQSIVFSAFHFAKYVGSGFMDVSQLLASAKFAAVAAVAGAAGAATGAGVSSGGGGASAGAATRSSARTGTTTAPTFTRNQQRQDNRPLNIQVFLGDPGDPSAAIIATKQIAAQLGS